MTLMTLLAYVTIGLSIGWLSREIFQDRGIKLNSSLVVGVAGAVLAVTISKILGVDGAAFFAVVGAIDMLYILNAFHEKPHVPIHTELNFHHTTAD
jgi:uncharacterized membrane protein YeaQ/YmgE (transglycosylase-associated protein family)